MAISKIQHTGGTYDFAGKSKFKQWRVYLNESHYALIYFYQKRNSLYTNVYWVELYESVKFDNPKDYDVLRKEIEGILERQKRLYPQQFKDQKKRALSGIKYMMKNYPKIFENENIAKHTQELIKFLRKRT